MYQAASMSAANAEQLAGSRVVNVETSSFRFVPDRDRERRMEILRIAESLGAEAVTLHGDTSATTIAGYARLRQASKILVGSPTRFGWQAVTQYARAAALKRLLPGIEILAIAPQASVVDIDAPHFVLQVAPKEAVDSIRRFIGSLQAGV